MHRLYNLFFNSSFYFFCVMKVQWYKFHLSPVIIVCLGILVLLLAKPSIMKDWPMKISSYSPVIIVCLGILVLLLAKPSIMKDWPMKQELATTTNTYRRISAYYFVYVNSFGFFLVLLAVNHENKLAVLHSFCTALPSFKTTKTVIELLLLCC
jgi:hypothetical protein